MTALVTYEVDGPTARITLDSRHNRNALSSALVEQLHQGFRDAAANPKVTFVGVAARSDVAAMQSFVSKYNLGFTNLNDTDGSIWARYDVPWQPAYVFYRADGSSTFVNDPTTAMPQQELSDRVAALAA